jgi:hypothetical protein
VAAALITEVAGDEISIADVALNFGKEGRYLLRMTD